MYQLGQIKQIHERCVIFVGYSTNAIPFTIPREARFVSMILIGGGGPGSGGVTGATNTSRKGGSGGGAGAISTAIFSARSLPETIYILLSNGGTGGIANSNGTADSVNSAVMASLATVTSIGSDIFLYANNGGIGLVGSTGGASGAVATINGNCVLGSRAISINLTAALGTGGAGGTGAGPNTTLLGLSNGGAAGGGMSGTTTAAGGSVVTANAVNIFNNLVNASVIVSGGAATVAGANGFDNIQGSVPFGSNSLPWYSVGGGGGGSIDVGTGGTGGVGGIGSGGGGGGAASTGGAGGTGGPGACIIEWW